jgi:hypothetical protein
MMTKAKDTSSDMIAARDRLRHMAKRVRGFAMQMNEFANEIDAICAENLHRKSPKAKAKVAPQIDIKPRVVRKRIDADKRLELGI